MDGLIAVLVMQKRMQSFYVVFLEYFVCKAWETLFSISQSSFALKLNFTNLTSLFAR
jgi:hypothetical protein